MHKPLVSVIMPAYNSEKYIGQAIASVLNQTWGNIELIIVDDGSADNTLSIARNFASDRVKVYSQANKGACAARNKALAEATGDYIQYLDADDLLSPDKISLQVEALENAPGKIALCSTVHFNYDDFEEAHNAPDDDDSDTYKYDDPVDFVVDMLGGYRKTGFMIAIHAWLTPRQIIDKAGPWNEQLSIDDDGEYFSRVILNSTGVIKTAGFNYYRKYADDGKIDYFKNNKEKLYKSAFDALLLKKQYLQARTNSPAAQRAFFIQLKYLAVMFFIEQPELYKQVNIELKKLPNYKFKPAMGGNIINLITRLLGWRTAKILQYCFARITKKNFKLS